MTASLALDDRAVARAAERSFRPRLFCRSVEADREALAALLGAGDVLFVHDTLMGQIEELLETRSPGRRIPRAELVLSARAHAGDAPADYGTWVYYPWSGRLVHVLPQGEYEELRTSRNRNKITRDEQTRLAALVVGIAGLSVGQSTAVTLALEGIGGVFRLADFDALSLSNMNRLREGVHSIGVNKAVLAAREIFEINPYVRVELFERGVADDTMDAFLGGEQPLGLLFEECDDLATKIRLRQEARKRGIPVLMETSDRGLLDVERFDREPTRPLFHGLVPEIDPARVAGLTAYEKVPLILGIVGRETMSPRLAASLVDIDVTLKTWPQLASAVALGGAINADVARRVALGRLTTSGRFFVDLETLVSDGPGALHAVPIARLSAHGEAAAPADEAKAATGSFQAAGGLQLDAGEPVSGALLEQLIELGTRAPSGGNAQPWRFTYHPGGTLRVWHDETRSGSFLDFEDRASHLAFGALAETLRLGAGKLHLGLALRPYPNPAAERLVCEGQVGGEAEALTLEDQGLADRIEERATSRRVSRREAIPPDDLAALGDIARRAGAELRILTDPAALEELGEVLGWGDRFRLLSPMTHREMMGEVRWSAEEAAATRDGLDLATLNLTPSDEAALRVVANPAVMTALRDVRGGHGLLRSARQAVAGAGAVGLLRMPFDPESSARAAYFHGGVALARVWLCATSRAVALQPMTALPYLFARLEHGGPGFDVAERTELEALRGRYRAVFGAFAGGFEGTYDALLFRMSRADGVAPRSLRRTVAQVLKVER